MGIASICDMAEFRESNSVMRIIFKTKSGSKCYLNSVIIEN